MVYLKTIIYHYDQRIFMVSYCPVCGSRLYPADQEDVEKYGICAYCTPNLEARKHFKSHVFVCTVPKV